MKILQVIASVNPEGGGPIEALTELGHILVREGDTCEIVSLDEPSSPWVKNFPLRLYPLGPGKTRLQYSPRLVSWIKENANHYDCVIVRGLWRYTSFATWCGLRNNGVPYFIYPHGMLDPWFRKKYPLKHLVKQLYWLVAEYRVLRDAKAVLFTSKVEQTLASESFFPYRCNEIVVRYGTSQPPSNLTELRLKFLTKFPQLKDKELFLFLGRIHEKKGCDLLIDAFSKVFSNDASSHLVIAGPDQTGWKQTLVQKAEQLGIDSQITWTGMLSGELKWGAFAASAAFILPSHQENFGIAVVEALSCEKPVLISKRINIWQEIEEAGCGLVADDTLEGTASLLEQWGNLSPGSKDEMGKRARDCFQQHFRSEDAAQYLITIIENCLG